MPPPRGPSLDHWTVWDEVLTTLQDGFASVRHAVVQASTDKRVKPPKPVRRPKTAAERAEARRERETHDSIRRKVLPHKYN